MDEIKNNLRTIKETLYQIFSWIVSELTIIITFPILILFLILGFGVLLLVGGFLCLVVCPCSILVNVLLLFIQLVTLICNLFCKELKNLSKTLSKMID